MKAKWEKVIISNMQPVEGKSEHYTPKLGLTPCLYVGR